MLRDGTIFTSAEQGGCEMPPVFAILSVCCDSDLSKSYVWIFPNFLQEVAVWNVRVKNYQVCSVQYRVQQLCAVQCIHI